MLGRGLGSHIHLLPMRNSSHLMTIKAQDFSETFYVDSAMHCANSEVILTVWLAGGGGRGAWAWRGMEGIPLSSSLLPQALGSCGRNLLTVLGQASPTSITGNELEQGLTNHRRAVKVNLQQELHRSAGRQCSASFPAQWSLRICKPHPLGKGVPNHA